MSLTPELGKRGRFSKVSILEPKSYPGARAFGSKRRGRGVYLYSLQNIKTLLGQFFFHIRSLNIVKAGNHQQTMVHENKPTVVMEHLHMNTRRKVGKDQVEMF